MTGGSALRKRPLTHLLPKQNSWELGYRQRKSIYTRVKEEFHYLKLVDIPENYLKNVHVAMDVHIGMKSGSLEQKGVREYGARRR